MIALRGSFDCKFDIIHFGLESILINKKCICLDFYRNLCTTAGQHIFSTFLIMENMVQGKNHKHLDHCCSLSKEHQNKASTLLTEENTYQCNFQIKKQQVLTLMKLKMLSQKQLQLCSFFCYSFFFFQFRKISHILKFKVFSF